MNGGDMAYGDDQKVYAHESYGALRINRSSGRARLFLFCEAMADLAKGRGTAASLARAESFFLRLEAEVAKAREAYVDGMPVFGRPR